MRKILRASAFALVAGAIGAQATASDIAFARTVAAPPVGGEAETVAVDIRSGDGVLWAGTLTMGPQYGNAYYSQSKNEYARPCEGERVANNGRANSNNSLNFNISRQNWQQQPDNFNVTFSWTRALQACEGQGTDTFGFNRQVEIKPGGSVVIEGANGVVVSVRRTG